MSRSIGTHGQRFREAAARPWLMGVALCAACLGCGDGQPGGDIHWRGDIAWTTWERGRRQAEAESKPIVLVLYVDWCGHCRALGAVFDNDEIEQLSSRMVMIRQNFDEYPDWLAPLAKRYGDYVPQILFMEPDGSVREDLTGRNRDHPFFYTPNDVDRIVENMRAMLES